MSISRRDIKRYIEHFLRCSASVNYKNITFPLMAVGTIELYSWSANYFLQRKIQQYLFFVSRLNLGIVHLCLHKPQGHPIVKEIMHAISSGYDHCLMTYSPTYSSYADLPRSDLPLELSFSNYTDCISAEDLATIDNVLRILLYGLILKFFIDAIPPLMPKEIDLDGALLRSLRINQKEDPYFPEIIVKMIEKLNLTESDFEEGLKGARVWVRSTRTHGPIFFPITTSAGRSYDMADLSMLKSAKNDPLTGQPLTGIYYNQTLFRIINHGIRDMLNQHPFLSDQEKQAFMVQYMRINESFQQNLQQEQWVDIQPENEEPSLFAIASSAIVVIAYAGLHVILPFFIPFACPKEAGGWQNPLPQLCEDLESALQWTTKGLQGAFEYGVRRASDCQRFTPMDCDLVECKTELLNNPYMRRDKSLSELARKEEQNLNIDSNIMLFVSIGLLSFILMQLVFLGTKLLSGNVGDVPYIEGTLSLLEDNQQSSVHKEEQGPTLQQLKDQYQEIQSQPNAERDKLTTLLLCTGCSSSYFKAQHEPCMPGAELVTDYDTTQLVANFPLAGQDKTEALNQRTPKPP